jgi:putative flippase GtrA
MRRFVRFNLVGCAGFLVQFLVLRALVDSSVPGLAATIVATEIALLHNFAWHVRWTWADRTSEPLRTVSGLSDRCLKFHLTNGVVSLAGGALLTWTIAAHADLSYPLANAVAVAVCSVINFALSDRIVFARRSVAHAPHHRRRRRPALRIENSGGGAGARG